MDEMIDLPINTSLAYELEQDLDFGTETTEETSAFTARVHSTPIGYRLIDLQLQAGTGLESKLSLFYDAYDLWLIPHRVSIMRNAGHAEPTSVGIEVEYLPNGRTCCIVALLPSFEYRIHGGATFGGAFSASGNAEPSTEDIVPTASLPSLGQVGLGVTAEMHLGFRFASTVATTKIAAVGVGSTRCEWRIDRDVEPLYGRDIETWAVVALPSVTTLEDHIKYKIRCSYNSRTFLFNTRRQTEYQNINCKLIKFMNTEENTVWNLLAHGPMSVDQIHASHLGYTKEKLKTTIGILEKRRLVRQRHGGQFAQA